MSHLEEHLNQNSQNSSRPSSKDGFGTPKASQKGKGGRKRGAQPGHPGHSRKLYPPDACQSTFEHPPETCAQCGEPLSGNDPTPYRHQIVEIPPIVPIVIEHRLHALCSEHCAEAHAYGQREAVLHSDETSFRQGNSDGQNEAKRQGWLWL